MLFLQKWSVAIKKNGLLRFRTWLGLTKKKLFFRPPHPLYPDIFEFWIWSIFTIFLPKISKFHIFFEVGQLQKKIFFLNSSTPQLSPKYNFYRPSTNIRSSSFDWTWLKITKISLQWVIYRPPILRMSYFDQKTFLENIIAMQKFVLIDCSKSEQHDI